MKVLYDNTLKVGGIGICPWTRLGPEKWFPEYKIASFFNPEADVDGMPSTYGVHGKGADTLIRYNSVQLLKEPAFQALLHDHFPGYKLFTYKSAEAPDAIEEYLLRPDERYAGLTKILENKAEFRRLFASDSIRFPEFTIYAKDSLLSLPIELLRKDAGVVVQDAVLSGGKGTFFVDDEESLLKAKRVLSKSTSTEVVVSKAVSNPNERSIQCVATKCGIFMGPVQAQIIDEPLLINRDVEGAEKFCGVVIDPHLTTAAQKQVIRSTAQQIGEKIVAMGYTGIFGIDFLIDENGEVFVLEVNPRITGATPLLTAFYSSDQFVPFYLLHILEIMNQDYEIEQIDGLTDAYSEIHPSSLMILHSQEATRVEVVKTVRTGIYSSNLEFIAPSVVFDDMKEGEYLIQSIAPAGVKVSPAARLLSIYYKGSVLDENGKISKKVQADIDTLYKNITVIEATKE